MRAMTDDHRLQIWSILVPVISAVVIAAVGEAFYVERRLSDQQQAYEKSLSTLELAFTQKLTALALETQSARAAAIDLQNKVNWLQDQKIALLERDGLDGKSLLKEISGKLDAVREEQLRVRMTVTAIEGRQKAGAQTTPPLAPDRQPRVAE